MAKAPTPPAADEIDLRDYLAGIWRRRLVVGITVFVVVALALIGSFLITPTYRAEARVQVTQQSAADQFDPNPGLLDSQRFLENQRDFVESDRVQEAAAEALGVDADVSVLIEDSADTLVFVGEADDADDAATAANTYAEVYIAQVQAAEVEGLEEAAAQIADAIASIDEQVAGIDGQIATIDAAGGEPAAERTSLLDQKTVLLEQKTELQTDQSQLQLRQNLATDGPAVLSQLAEPPDSPASPDVVRNGLVALVAGLVLGIAIAFVLDLLDSSIRGREQLEASTGLPVLGQLPAARPDDEGAAAATATTEAVRSLRTSVQLLVLDRGVRRVLLAPVRSGHDAADAAAELAASLAAAGQRVLLVDADLRAPSLHRRFDLPAAPGLTDVLAGDDAADRVRAVDHVPGLSLLPAGDPVDDATRVLGLDRAREAFGRLGEEHDVVLVLGPALLPLADARILGRLVDAVVLVVAQGRDRGRDVRTALTLLGQLDEPVAGSVLTRVALADAVPYLEEAAAPTDDHPAEPAVPADDGWDAEPEADLGAAEAGAEVSEPEAVEPEAVEAQDDEAQDDEPEAEAQDDEPEAVAAEDDEPEADVPTAGADEPEAEDDEPEADEPEDDEPEDGEPESGEPATGADGTEVDEADQAEPADDGDGEDEQAAGGGRQAARARRRARRAGG